nr:MAG TPA: hypothetical protein [Caudoviricetes sp.]
MRLICSIQCSIQEMILCYIACHNVIFRFLGIRGK